MATRRAELARRRRSRKIFLGARVSSWAPPSYLDGHSALSRASSRHSGGKGLLTLTASDPDPGHGSVRLLARRAVPGSPDFASKQGRGGEVDVVMTLAMEADGTLKVSQELGGNTQSGAKPGGRLPIRGDFRANPGRIRRRFRGGFLDAVGKHQLMCWSPTAPSRSR